MVSLLLGLAIVLVLSAAARASHRKGTLSKMRIVGLAAGFTEGVLLMWAGTHPEFPELFLVIIVFGTIATILLTTDVSRVVSARVRQYRSGGLQ